jgi:tRNA A22 N-methylase
MENKNNISENGNNLPPILTKIGKENSFSVPKNYFEVLPQVINDKKLNNKRIVNIFDNLSYRILAPTLGVLTLIMTIYILQPNNTTLELTNEQLSEIIINEELIEFDENLVYEVYAETESTSSSEQTTDEEIIDYLINDNISINLIIDEL